MSEYQYVAFRAIDAPVSEKNLRFMRQQSTRAEITPWAFDNDYHFGDFHGNAHEMLRRGYDFHLHYANFGIRTLMIRLPTGLPDASAAARYLNEESLTFVKDKQGPGGILRIEPFFEAGELDELGELEGIIDRLLPLRAEILAGDLRPLYLAHLAVACDGNHDPDETQDAPVPAGLQTLTHAQRALAEFYGLSKAFIAAAARDSPALPKPTDEDNQYTLWLRNQPEATCYAWLTQLMVDPHSTVRREIMAEFQRTQNASAWPTVHVDRTVAELEAAADDIARKSERQAEDKAARARVKKLAQMAGDPTKTIRETEQLVKERTFDTYAKIATLLADLREALAGGQQSGLAEEQARKLRDQNPTLKMLVSALRLKGFLPK